MMGAWDDFIKGAQEVGGAIIGAIVRGKVGTGADFTQKAITGNKTISETVTDVTTGKTNSVDEFKENVQGTGENVYNAIPGKEYIPWILAGGAALLAVSVLNKK